MLFDKIRELCEKKGMNPSRLESELGFGRGTLYTWRKSSPSVDKLQKVADYFNVTVDYLLGTSSIEKLESKSDDIDEDIRVIARGMQKLKNESPDDFNFVKKLLKTMSDKADEELNK